ncbi:uncharacterized protein LOC143788805 [Ranitomeya variabilis]|uniref:uncharacterized protein LOC143788805 n=1 Tax=Ranitomeya variabilis TaxID=490064 RepID=UPI00405709F9
MKNIAVFLLVGLGLFSSGYSIDVNAVAGLGRSINKCLTEGFQNAPEQPTSLSDVTCKKPDQSDIEKVKETVQAILDYLENLPADVLDEVNKLGQSIVDDNLEHLKVVITTVCKLVNPALKSECEHELAQTVGSLAGKALKDLLLALKCKNTDPNGINLETVKKGLGDTDPGNGWGCLIEALKKSPDALKTLSKFICDYRRKFDGNVKNYEAAFDNVKDTLKKLGCEADYLLGTDATIKDTAGNVTEVGAHAGRVVLKLTDALNLFPFVTAVLCDLTEGALTSTCLDNIFGKGIDALSAFDIFELLEQLGCFLGATIGTKEGVENLVDKFGEGLAPPLKNIFQGLRDKIVAAFPLAEYIRDSVLGKKIGVGIDIN